MNILAHPGIIGFQTLEMNQLVHHFTEFPIRINEDTLASQTTLLRLRQFQLQHKIVSPIWSLDYNTLSRLNFKGNLAAAILYRMSSLDVSIQYCRDQSEWSISGSSQDITSIFLENGNIPPKVIKSYWLSDNHIYRLGQCIVDNKIIPWAIVKAAHGQSKKGRTPDWFKWISAHYHTMDLSGSTSEMPIVHTDIPTTDKRRKEWVSFTTSTNSTIIGRIASKPRSNSTIITHWIPRSTIHEYKVCTGCEHTMWNSELNECTSQQNRLALSSIPEHLVSHNKQQGVVQTFPMVSHTISRQSIPRNSLVTLSVDSLDIQLIKSALIDNTARQSLINVYWELYHQYDAQTLEFYTDGSLDSSKRSSDDATIMGSSWIVPNLNISYSCASINWPSSTKAELVAIWTAMLAAPSDCSIVNIYTDSQAAINGILKGQNNNATIRQYFKTPNAMLIEQII